MIRSPLYSCGMVRPLLWLCHDQTSSGLARMPAEASTGSLRLCLSSANVPPRHSLLSAIERVTRVPDVCVPNLGFSPTVWRDDRMERIIGRGTVTFKRADFWAWVWVFKRGLILQVSRTLKLMRCGGCPLLSQRYCRSNTWQQPVLVPQQRLTSFSASIAATHAMNQCKRHSNTWHQSVLVV